MLAKMSDAVKEYAHNLGHDNQDVAWILSPYDTWEKNPFYLGPKVPHPEDEHEFVGEYDYDQPREFDIEF
jgi:hypothetical protein